MPGCIVSATTANFSSVEKRRLRATPVITSTFENVSDIGTCLGLFLGPLGYRPCPVKTGCSPIRRAHVFPDVAALQAALLEKEPRDFISHHIFEPITFAF